MYILNKNFPKKHTKFPQKIHNFHNKLFNCNNVRISYSCMPNVNSAIHNHNKSILHETEAINKTCNYIKKDFCPLDNLCLTSNIVYEATVKSNYPTNTPKHYIGICEGTFKNRFSNHKKSFNHQRYENETELSKEVWKLKSKNEEPTVTWKIKKKCTPFNPTSGKCNLCLSEKLLISSSDHQRTSSKCRHQNKFKQRK